MLTSEDVETILRQWGRIFGSTPCDEPTSGTERGILSSVLGSLHVGEGSVATKARRKIREYIGSDGKVRRESAPLMMCHAKETRSVSRGWTPPTEMLDVENAAIDLYHFNKLRGVVLRMEYCIHRTPQREKAIMVGKIEGINDRITVRRYRHELECARQYMAGCLRSRKTIAA